MNSTPITRRDFLRSAGGITFLALTPIGRGLFAAETLPALIPIFTALPYIQPGDCGALIAGKESMRLLWQTGGTVAEFTVRFGEDKTYERSAEIAWKARGALGMEPRLNYCATMTGLALGKRHEYEVRCNGTVIAAGFFTTRQPRGRSIRFVAFGDNSYGDISDRAIAFQAYQAHPDFVMNTGDNVYEGGLDNEYARYFFPVYNADVAEARSGAPLLRSVPFYSVLANHDVHRLSPTGGPIADFTLDPDSLGYYTNFYYPTNGPQPPNPTPTVGPFEAFRQSAGERFPRMANYSYDFGDAHFTCLDSNLYLNPADPVLLDWIENDLKKTDARWKFVVYHHPCFNVGYQHWREQQMRALCPLLEKQGVDFVLSGHEHNYQRTRPLFFKPKDTSKASALGEKDRRVPGEFILDGKFDGKEETSPRGILYITTGAGGKRLYDPDHNNNPSKWLLEDDGNAEYIVKMISDRHSLTVFDIDGQALLMRQIDEFGNEIDRMRVTKA